MTKFEIEEKIVAMLKTVFDPEIPGAANPSCRTMLNLSNT